MQLSLLKLLDPLRASKQLLSPRNVELLVWCAVFFYVDAEGIKEVRCIEQVRLVVQVEHIVRPDTVSDHADGSGADVLAELVCEIEVSLVVNGRAIVPLAGTLYLDRPFRFQFPDQSERILERVRIVPRYQFVRYLFIVRQQSPPYQIEKDGNKE